MERQRVKLMENETLGGPNTQPIEAIPVAVEHAIPHDVLAYVPIGGQPRLAKERAAEIVTLLNDSAGDARVYDADELTRLQGEGEISGDTAAAAVLSESVYAAVTKIHEIIENDDDGSFKWVGDPYVALQQLEHALDSAGLQVPERPKAVQKRDPHAKKREPGQPDPSAEVGMPGADKQWT